MTLSCDLPGFCIKYDLSKPISHMTIFCTLYFEKACFFVTRYSFGQMSGETEISSYNGCREALFGPIRRNRIKYLGQRKSIFQRGLMGYSPKPKIFERDYEQLNGTASPWGAAASPEGRW